MNSLLGNYCHVSNQINAYTDEPTDAAALFNENKGEAATDLAQDCDFKTWVFDFFKYLQNSKPAPFTKPNLEFLNLRGA